MSWGHDFEEIIELSESRKWKQWRVEVGVDSTHRFRHYVSDAGVILATRGPQLRGCVCEWFTAYIDIFQRKPIELGVAQQLRCFGGVSVNSAFSDSVSFVSCGRTFITFLLSTRTPPALVRLMGFLSHTFTINSCFPLTLPAVKAHA